MRQLAAILAAVPLFTALAWATKPCPPDLLALDLAVSEYKAGGVARASITVTAARSEKRIKITPELRWPSGPAKNFTSKADAMVIAELAAGQSAVLPFEFTLTGEGQHQLTFTLSAESDPERFCPAYNTVYYTLLAAPKEVLAVKTNGGTIIEKCAECALADSDEVGYMGSPAGGLAAKVICPKGDVSPFEPIKAEAVLVNTSTTALKVPLRDFGRFGFYLELHTAERMLNAQLAPENPPAFVTLAPGQQYRTEVNTTLAKMANSNFVSGLTANPLMARLVFYSYPLEYFAARAKPPMWSGHILSDEACKITFRVP